MSDQNLDLCSRDAENVAMNQEFFREQTRESFVEGSPHLKHKALGVLFEEMVTISFGHIVNVRNKVAVLDMGAGDGALTLPWLALGAEVLAADASAEQLHGLEQAAAKHRCQLTTMQGDIFRTLDDLEGRGCQFDVIGTSAFLHHIPDYLELCRCAAGLLRKNAVFFTFQDPLRYDTLGRFTHFFDRISYFGWRLFQGKLLQGLKTRLRRMRGSYRDDLPEDMTEYHVVRNGVDQLALVACLESFGFECRVHSYWSTQSRFFQWAGEALHLANTFGIIATRK